MKYIETDNKIPVRKGTETIVLNKQKLPKEIIKIVEESRVVNKQKMEELLTQIREDRYLENILGTLFYRMWENGGGHVGCMLETMIEE
jgi:hypothetical protein